MYHSPHCNLLLVTHPRPIGLPSTNMVSHVWCNLKLLLLFSVVTFISIAGVAESSRQFTVGGRRGWTLPTFNQTETYNQWASNNRFQIGDSLYFKYSNDSVLVVAPDEYRNCNTTNPIVKYEDGETVFKFDRFGFFYFISGSSKHCKGGQRLIVQVMGQSNFTGSPTMAPSPSSNGGDAAGPGPSSSPTSSSVKVQSFGVGQLMLAWGIGLIVLSGNNLFA